MRHINSIILFAVVFQLLSCNQPESTQQLTYPITDKVDTVDQYFDTEVSDPYRWLEDDRSEKTGQWVKAQNEVTSAYLSQIDFKEAIQERLTELIDYEKVSAPFHEGDYYYYYQNDGLQNQSVLFQTKDANQPGEVFIDPNTFSEDGTVSLSTITFSNDGQYAAYSVSVSGSDWREIYVMNTETKEKLSDKVEWAKFTSMSWRDGGFYYQGFDKPKEGDELKGTNEFGKIYYHKIGTSQEDDQLVHQNPDNPNNRFFAWVSEDERYLVIYSTESTSGNELYFIDLKNDPEKLVTIVTGFENDHNVITTEGDRLFIETNLGAPNNRLVVANVNNPTPENWVDVIPETENVLSASIAGNNIFATYLEDAKTAIRRFGYDGTPQGDVELPGIGTARGFSGNKEDNEFYYTFTSFIVPSSVYKYDLPTGKSTLFRGSKVNFNPDGYETKQVFYKSKDGTEVPMFIVHKKGIELNGKNPTWLYAYGGFNISLRPSFSASRIVWLENGGVYAQPNIRGGGEYGETWHKAGTKLQKKNVFEDFIAAGEYLIENGYTTSEYLAIEGGSNGGLLIGATINMRPDLARVAYPRVGVLDMLRYQNFTIGRAWATDYGTAQDSKEMFEYLYSYSPLHNISSVADYPATMVMTADHDDRVVPAHSFKYAATLQEKYQGNNPVLIRIETSAGHGAGTSTSKQIEQRADMYSFAWYNMGIIPEMVKKNL